jgi:hypothetical protein
MAGKRLEPTLPEALIGTRTAVRRKHFPLHSGASSQGTVDTD